MLHGAFLKFVLGNNIGFLYKMFIVSFTLGIDNFSECSSWGLVSHYTEKFPYDVLLIDVGSVQPGRVPAANDTKV